MGIWMVLIFIVGFVLGLWVAWLYWQREKEGQDAEIHNLRARLNEKEKSLQECQEQVQKQEAATEPAALAAATEPDDLKRIEGIGPKISGVLQEHGIRTFAQLADADEGRLQKILQETNLRLADPATWSEQARLAAAGDWEALQVLQDELKGGRRT